MRCMLFIIRCSLSAICYFLMIIRYSLFIIRYNKYLASFSIRFSLFCILHLFHLFTLQSSPLFAMRLPCIIPFPLFVFAFRYLRFVIYFHYSSVHFRYWLFVIRFPLFDIYIWKPFSGFWVLAFRVLLIDFRYLLLADCLS